MNRSSGRPLTYPAWSDKVEIRRPRCSLPHAHIPSTIPVLCFVHPTRTTQKHARSPYVGDELVSRPKEPPLEPLRGAFGEYVLLVARVGADRSTARSELSSGAKLGDATGHRPATVHVPGALDA